jgi:glycosyltransferase involved in cell wall biosynthesis
MVFVGRLDEEKRIDESIRALPVLLRHRDVQLVLAGTGQRREELERLARSLGVAERVHFLGFVPDDDLPLVYVAADLFVIGSVAELQSIATLEAMSTGLPVVAADALALPHLVRPGRNGYLYPPGDVAQLAQRLLDVLESPDRRTAMGRASRDIAQTHDHHRSLDRFEQIYTEVRPRSWTLSRSASPAARQRDTTVAA